METTGWWFLGAWHQAGFAQLTLSEHLLSLEELYLCANTFWLKLRRAHDAAIWEFLMVRLAGIVVELPLLFWHKLGAHVGIFEGPILLPRCVSFFFAKLDLTLGLDRPLNVFLSISNQIKLLKGFLFEDGHVDRNQPLLALFEIATLFFDG